MGAARTKHWHLKTCHGVRKLCCSQNQLSLRSLPLCPQRQEFCWLSNFRQNVELDWKQKEKQTKVPHPPVLGAQRAERCWRDACLAGWAAQDTPYSTRSFVSKQSYKQKEKNKSFSCAVAAGGIARDLTAQLRETHCRAGDDESRPTTRLPLRKHRREQNRAG